jgi:hypothetical protein
MSALTVTDAERLVELESVVERGLQTFIEVGNALREIRDGHLYQATHGTFESYCRERWHVSRAHAYRLMAAAGQASLSPTGDIPANEHQARVQMRAAERAEEWDRRYNHPTPEEAAEDEAAAADYKRRNAAYQAEQAARPAMSDEDFHAHIAVNELLDMAGRAVARMRSVDGAESVVRELEAAHRHLRGAAMEAHRLNQAARAAERASLTLTPAEVTNTVRAAFLRHLTDA